LAVYNNQSITPYTFYSIDLPPYTEKLTSALLPNPNSFSAMQAYTPLSSKTGVFIVKHGFEGDTASYFSVAAPECTTVVVAKVIFQDMAVALG
jgi:hypothetical protein